MDFRKFFPVNCNEMERVVRLVVGVAILVMSEQGYFGLEGEFYATFFGAIGVISGVTGYCPIMGIFHIKTTKD